MVVRNPLSPLYLDDETAWLDEMARLIAERRLDALDYDNLKEYLSDMARRDRREVKSRLTLLLAHLLKWQFQPEKRTGSWLATIVTQRQELADLAGSGVLRNHAESVMAECYASAVELVRAETGTQEGLPAECPYVLDQLLVVDLSDE